jgi:hypothetical protein
MDHLPTTRSYQCRLESQRELQPQGPTTFPVLRRQKGSLWPNQHTFPVLGRLPWMHPAASSDHQRVLRTLRDAQTSSTEASAAERFTDAMPF